MLDLLLSKIAEGGCGNATFNIYFSIVVFCLELVCCNEGNQYDLSLTCLKKKGVMINEGINPT